ncbi:hypothetical protein GGP41_007152 [Bipolaris sorokiniana]|uniref:Uncharacterized protein n=1 Tax=Cochliobolus sativus TaxID=45130 RepID=A0A8H5ZS83_COCSA|nr:hypothetical protein GGP41_007152 [Bipolaris sorokiniana]
MRKELTNIVVTYLNYGVFGTEASKTKVVPIMTQSAPSTILQSDMNSPSSTRHLAMKFLKSRRQPVFDMSKMIAEAHTSFHSEDCRGANSFSFYEYANRHWLKHLSHVSGQDAAMFRLSSKLIHSRESALKIAKDDQWNDKGVDESTALMWAVKRRQMDTTEILINTRKADVNAKDT